MLEEKHTNGAGEPKPLDLTDGFTTLIDVGTLVAVVCAGILAFPKMVTPTRLSGATRSAKLRWERANAEVEHAIACSEHSQAPLVGETSKSSPPKEDE